MASEVQTYREIKSAISNPQALVFGQGRYLPKKAAEMLKTFNKSIEFCCEGVVPRVVLSFQKDGEAVEILSDHLSDERVKLLKSVCSPANFGLGERTVYDPEVRKAFSCDLRTLGVDLQGHDAVVKRTVLNSLYPHLEEGEVEMTPYRLNIYETGDFFKSHVDSVEDDRQLASVVLCLPFPHTGGVLTVDSSNSEISSRAVELCQEPGSSSVRWAAFYTDCLHEISPVTSGTRITLTFKVHLAAGATLEREFVPTPEPKLFIEEEFQFLKNPVEHELFKNPVGTIARDTLKDDRQETRGSAPVRFNYPVLDFLWKLRGPDGVGLICTHLYNAVPLKPAMLKGVDRVLFKALDGFFEVHIISVVLTIKVDWGDVDTYVKNMKVCSFDAIDPPKFAGEINFYTIGGKAELFDHSSDFAGNDGQPAKYHYRTYALVVLNRY